MKHGWNELEQGLEWKEEPYQEGSGNCALSCRQAEHRGSEHTAGPVATSSQLIWRGMCLCVMCEYVWHATMWDVCVRCVSMSV